MSGSSVDSHAGQTGPDRRAGMPPPIVTGPLLQVLDSANTGNPGLLKTIKRHPGRGPST